MSGAVAEAERLLTELRAARDAVTTNLLDLEADGAYSLLKAGDGLSGATAAKAKPALAQVDELWRGLQLLDSLIDEADRIRGGGRLDERRADTLVKMLTGRSIALPAQAVPLAQRTLTGASATARTVTPQDLLAGMEQAFGPLRDVVAAVDKTWRELLPEVERLTAEADRLAADLPGHRGLAAAKAKLQTIAGRIAEDPLGVTADFADAEATLAALRQMVQDRRDDARRLTTDLAAAARDLDELAALIDAGRIGLAQSRQDVAAPTGLFDPVDPVVLTGERGLDPWLARLRDLQAEGEVDKAILGLQRWRALADQTLKTARKVAQANARPSERRRELRGLLRAAKVKGGARGRAEDAALTELARLAEEALARPCDLAIAEAAVTKYLQELRRTGRDGPRRQEASG